MRREYRNYKWIINWKTIAMWDVLHGKEAIAVVEKYLPIFYLFFCFWDIATKNITMTVYRLFLHIAIRRGSKHSRTIIITGQSLTAEVSLSSSIKGKYPITSQIGVRLKDFAHLIPLLHSTIYFWIMSNLFYLQTTWTNLMSKIRWPLHKR